MYTYTYIITLNTKFRILVLLRVDSQEKALSNEVFGVDVVADGKVGKSGKDSFSLDMVKGQRRFSQTGTGGTMNPEETYTI